MKRLTTRDESGYYHLRRGPKGGEINKITVVQHLGRLEDVAFRPVSREQVEKGRWIFRPYEKMPWCTQAICSECGSVVENNSSLSQESGIKLFVESNPFCRRCGAPMTDEAVQMVMERLEALHSETKTD